MSLAAGYAPGSAVRWGFLLPQALADAFHISAINSASVLMQPCMLSTPSSSFLEDTCGYVSLVSAVSLLFALAFLHVSFKLNAGFHARLQLHVHFPFTAAETAVWIVKTTAQLVAPAPGLTACVAMWGAEQGTKIPETTSVLLSFVFSLSWELAVGVTVLKDLELSAAGKEVTAVT